jgi:hypothetical protein
MRQPSSPFQFFWQVPKGGHHWAEGCLPGEATPQSVLCWQSPTGREYAPLQEHTGLFREFAGTGETPEAVLAFANRYGSLGIARPLSPPPGSREPRVYGEPFAEWCAHIRALREQVNLGDMVRRGDVERLAQLVLWQKGTAPGERLCVVYPRSYTEPQSAHLGGGQGEPFHPGDVIGPALASLQTNVNGHLQGRVSPQLLHIPRRGEMGLYLVPSSLLGALWLQLAQAVAGDKEHRQCAQCGKWFEVSPGTARPDRVFCSTACRSRAYRERKERAREMHAAGKTAKEIAKELGTGAGQVKKWVANTKG